ncbi:hypothetical protein L7F22_030897 [Adiantum nelumboides]|nr:hypothetical protein [Adiantum nelumboides]
MGSSRLTRSRAAVEENRHSSTTRNVRFCLNKEELQQEDWRSRYIQLLSRSQKWEKTLQLKDSTLQYLREALQDREIALKRQEKLIEETKQRLDFQGKSEKAHLEKKELEVSLLRAKAIGQAEKLAEQNKLISVLNSHHNKREQEYLNYSNNVQRKVDKLQVRLRSVEVSSQSREEDTIAETEVALELVAITAPTTDGQPSTSNVGTSCSFATQPYDEFDDDNEEEEFADENEELSGYGEHSEEESFDNS